MTVAHCEIIYILCKDKMFQFFVDCVVFWFQVFHFGVITYRVYHQRNVGSFIVRILSVYFVFQYNFLLRSYSIVNLGRNNLKLMRLWYLSSFTRACCSTECKLNLQGQMKRDSRSKNNLSFEKKKRVANLHAPSKRLLFHFSRETNGR